MGLQFTLELAKDAELNWKMATPSERLVLLKNVHSNFLLDGLTVRYDLKKVFGILAQIKLNGVSKKWCAKGDLNPHTFRHMHLKHTCLPFHHPRF